MPFLKCGQSSVPAPFKLSVRFRAALVLTPNPLYRRHRFPAEIIAHAVWLYFRFPLSLRMVEDLLAARGVIVSHQTVRLWAEKFGRAFANEIRRRSVGRLGDKWHLDEAVVSIRGKKHWLWRAVDQDGFVLEVLVQSRRACRNFLRLTGCSPSLGKFRSRCSGA